MVLKRKLVEQGRLTNLPVIIDFVSTAILAVNRRNRKVFRKNRSFFASIRACLQ